MSMDGEILQRLADHEARLKALEIKAGLRQADGGTMAVAMCDEKGAAGGVVGSPSHTFIGEVRQAKLFPRKTR